MRGSSGAITGIIRISRDVRAPIEAYDMPAGFAAALDHFENDVTAPIAPSAPPRSARSMKGSFGPKPGRSIAKTRTAVESRRSAASTTTAPSLGLPRHDRNDVDPVPARLSRALWVHAAVRALAPDQACWIVAVQSVVSGESTAASIGGRRRDERPGIVVRRSDGERQRRSVAVAR